MTESDSTQTISETASGSNPIAYRELWKSPNGERTATVEVRLDGTMKIESRRRVASERVLETLTAEGLRFVRLLHR